MKIYISVDGEGASGVATVAEMKPGESILLQNDDVGC